MIPTTDIFTSDEATMIRSILSTIHDMSDYLEAEVPLRHLKNTKGVKVYSTPHFNVGDIVSRDGSDRQRVISTDGTDEYAPTMIEVECIKEPATDELSPEPWCRLGEREHNLARRYWWADNVIDGEATLIAGKLEKR